MQIRQILSAERTFNKVAGSSKKKVIENISSTIAQHMTSLDEDIIFNGLFARERLGSTGLGDGIAIPHCRTPNCSFITGSLFKLETPVDFGSPDGKPVDLLFVILAPEDSGAEHLQALALLASRFSEASWCSALRQAEDAQLLYNAAISMDTNETEATS